MSSAPSRIGQHLKTLGKFQIVGLVMWTLGGIYTAALMTFPRLLAIAVRLM